MDSPSARAARLAAIAPEPGRLWVNITNSTGTVHIATGERAPSGDPMSHCGLTLGAAFFPLPIGPLGERWAGPRPGCVPCQREAGITLRGDTAAADPLPEGTTHAR